MNASAPTISKPLDGSLSPLHMAAMMSSDAVEHMLSVMRRTIGRDALADVVNLKANDDSDFNGGYTALHYACQRGLPKAVRLLLEAGANPNAKKNNGASPLICSISSAGWNHGEENTNEENLEMQTECIRMLLSHPKFDLAVNDQDGDGRCSPAWMCVGQEFQYADILTDVLDMLLARGFDANGTIHNRPALHMALFRGHVICALKLVKAGADIYTMALPNGDNDGDEPWTALQAARSNYGVDFANRLEEAALGSAAVAGNKTRLKILRANQSPSSSINVTKLAQKSIKTAEQLMQVGRWGAAAAAYEEALGYNEDVLSKKQRYTTLNNISACMIQACRTPEAVDYSRQLVQEFPDNPMCHITLATTLCHHQMKTGCAPNWDKMAESCAQAETLFDASRGNEWWLEHVGIEQGRELMKKVRRSIPNQETLNNPAIQAAQVALDNLHGSDGDIVKAAQAIDKSLDPELNHPNPLTMRINRGSIYYQLGVNILEVASDDEFLSGPNTNGQPGLLSLLEGLSLEEQLTQAKEKFEIAMEEYDHCMHANDGRFAKSVPVWNKGLALIVLGRFNEGSQMCLEGLRHNLKHQLEKYVLHGDCHELMPDENASNKDFMRQVDLAFESTKMLIKLREKIATNACTMNTTSIESCETAAAKLRLDCAETIVDSVRNAHRQLKATVSTRVIGTLIKEALDWDSNCEIPEELQKAQSKVVPESRCAMCGIGGPMQSCPCKEVHYCRKECQVKAWKEHKKVCNFHKNRATKKAQE